MRPIRFRSFVPFFAPGLRRCPVRPVLRAVPSRAETYLTPIRDAPRIRSHQGLRAVGAAFAAGSQQAERLALGATALGNATARVRSVCKRFVRLWRRPGRVRVQSSAPGSVRAWAADGVARTRRTYRRGTAARRRAPRSAPTPRAGTRAGRARGAAPARASGRCVSSRTLRCTGRPASRGHARTPGIRCGGRRTPSRAGQAAFSDP